jgi:hypothetical protein
MMRYKWIVFKYGSLTESNRPELATGDYSDSHN